MSEELHLPRLASTCGQPYEIQWDSHLTGNEPDEEFGCCPLRATWAEMESGNIPPHLTAGGVRVKTRMGGNKVASHRRCVFCGQLF